MSDTPEDIARRAAGRLAREIDPALPAVVEGQLRGGGGAEPPVRFLEPATTIALGGLLVSLASMAILLGDHVEAGIGLGSAPLKMIIESEKG